MPPPPPQRPIRNNHTNLLQNPNTHHPTLPDLLVTAHLICFLFSSSTTKATLFSKTPFLHFPSSPRRFLKILIMFIQHFATLQSVSAWLKPRLLSDSLASWGVKPGTKNFHNLWLQLSEGESSLADSTPPVQTVQVVTVMIIDDKFRVKDSGNSGILKMVPGSYEKKVEERHSVSYPSLPRCYVLNSMDAWVDGLPEREFCSEEEHEYANYGEMGIAHEAVSVKKHFWK